MPRTTRRLFALPTTLTVKMPAKLPARLPAKLPALMAVVAALLLAMTTPAWSQNADAPVLSDMPEDFPLMERYIDSRNVNAFAREVVRFMQANGESPWSARAALDLMMLSALSKNAAVEQDMRQFIVMSHANTIPGRYLISRFENGKAFREFIVDNLRDENGAFRSRPLRQFPITLRLGIQDLGDEVLNDPTFLLLTASIARIASDTELAKSCRDLLDRRFPNDLKAAALIRLLQDESANFADVIVKANDYDHPGVEYVQDIISLALSAADRERPDIVAIWIDKHLHLKRYDRALVGLDTLQKSIDDGAATAGNSLLDPARLTFLRAWALTMQRRRDDAVQAMETMSEAHPDSPWTVQAKPLADALAGWDDHVDANVDALIAVFNALIKAEQIEFRMQSIEGGQSVTISVVEGKSVSFWTVIDGKPGIICYLTDAGLKLYVQNDASIQQFIGEVRLPTPTLSLIRNAGTGNFAFTMEGRDVANPNRTLMGNLRNVLGSPFLTTKVGLRDMLEHVAEGAAPVGAEQLDGGLTRYRWLRANIDAPGFTTSYVMVDDQSRLQAASLYGVTLDRIHYGRSGDFKAALAPWPDLPTTEQKLDLVKTLELLRSVVAQLKNAYTTAP